MSSKNLPKMKHSSRLELLLLLGSLFVCIDGTVTLKRFSSSSLRPTHHPTATVVVPPGWKVVSGGADVAFGGAGQLLTKSYPTAAGRGWIAQSKDHIRSDPGRITVYAIAMYDPNDEWEVRVFSKFSARVAHPSETVSVANGYTLVGGGANVLWSGSGNLLVKNYPSGSSWVASSKDHKRPSPASLIVYAIGIRSRRGVRLDTKQIFEYNGPRGHNRKTVSAPTGYKVIGGGARVTTGGTGNMLVDCFPYTAALSSFTAYSKDHITPDAQFLVVYVIAVKGARHLL